MKERRVALAGALRQYADLLEGTDGEALDEDKFEFMEEHADVIGEILIFGDYHPLFVEFSLSNEVG